MKLYNQIKALQKQLQTVNEANKALILYTNKSKDYLKDGQQKNYNTLVSNQINNQNKRQSIKNFTQEEKLGFIQC